MITERHTQENSHDDLGMEVPRTETSLERPGKDEDLSDTDVAQAKCEEPDAKLTNLTTDYLKPREQ